MTLTETLTAIATANADQARLLSMALDQAAAATTTAARMPPPTSADLPAAITSAAQGSTPPIVSLAPGGSYSLPTDYRVPTKDLNRPIWIRTAGGCCEPPARIVGEWRHDTVLTGGYHLENLHLQGLPNRVESNLITHGLTNAVKPEEQPEAITYVRVTIDGTATGYRRGILANSRKGVLAHVRILNAFNPGRDAQALCGFNGMQDWTVRDSVLEGSTENILLGGGSSMGPNMLPTRVTFLRTKFTKPRAWQTLTKPTAKNLVELKAGVDITFADCQMESSWGPTQNGAGIVIKACNSGEKNPDGTPGDWVRTENVTIKGCVVSGVGVGLVLVGKNEGGPTRQGRNWNIIETVFHDIGKDDGTGIAIRVADGPADVHLEDVAFDNAGNFLDVWPNSASGISAGWTMTRVAGRSGPYGFKGEATGMGQPTLDRFFPGIVLQDVEFVRNSSATLPPGVVATIDETMLLNRMKTVFAQAMQW